MSLWVFVRERVDSGFLAQSAAKFEIGTWCGKNWCWRTMPHGHICLHSWCIVLRQRCSKIHALRYVVKVCGSWSKLGLRHLQETLKPGPRAYRMWCWGILNYNARTAELPPIPVGYARLTKNQYCWFTVCSGLESVGNAKTFGGFATFWKTHTPSDILAMTPSQVVPVALLHA